MSELVRQCFFQIYSQFYSQFGGGIRRQFGRILNRGFGGLLDIDRDRRGRGFSSKQTGYGSI